MFTKAGDALLWKNPESCSVVVCFASFIIKSENKRDANTSTSPERSKGNKYSCALCACACAWVVCENEFAFFQTSSRLFQLALNVK